MAKMTKKAQVLELLDAGWSATEAAKEVGTSRQYVYSLRYKVGKTKKAAPKKKQPATANGKVDAAAWLKIKEVTLSNPKVGYEITVRTLGLGREELDDLLASARVYGSAAVTKVVDLK